MVDRDLVAEERAAARHGAGRDNGRGSGMDAGTRRLALIAGGIGALLVATVGGWSLLGQRPVGIPLIAPSPGPVRVRPTDPGGMQLMAGQVAQTNGPAAQTLAPGPEAAAPQALQAEVDAARKADAPAVPAPKVAAATPAAVPVPASPPASPPAAASLRPATGVAPAVAAPSADAAADAPAALAATSPNAGTAPDPAPAAPTAQAASAPAVGGHAVQLAALDSDMAARAEWSRLVRQAPTLLADRAPVILHISRGGRQFYRLRTGGFASIADATAFCGRARISGIACTLADF